MKKDYLFFILILFTVTACTNAVRLPNYNDSKTYLIECNGLTIPLLICFEKAKEKCANGYYLIDRTTGEIAIAGGLETDGNKKSMLIRCAPEQKDTIIK